MEDVGRVPEAASLPTLEPATVPTLDGWIESLMKCKQLPEADVQRLCEKVRCRFTCYRVRPAPPSGLADRSRARVV
jgi:hypothetical protein